MTGSVFCKFGGAGIFSGAGFGMDTLMLVDAAFCGSEVLPMVNLSGSFIATEIYINPISTQMKKAF